MITDQVGLQEVGKAFERLTDSSEPVKIIVRHDGT
jgi:hypothetical protein